jgi:ABC-type molybdate transport system, periplasmic component
MRIVYGTDAAPDAQVSVVGTYPSEEHPHIVYPAALDAERESAAARGLLDWLQGDATRAAFARQGYAILSED